MCFICIHKIAIIMVGNNLEWSFSVYQYIWDVFRKLNSFVKHFSAFPVELKKQSIHFVKLLGLGLANLVPDFWLLTNQGYELILHRTVSTKNVSVVVNNSIIIKIIKNEI